MSCSSIIIVGEGSQEGLAVYSDLKEALDPLNRTTCMVSPNFINQTFVNYKTTRGVLLISAMEQLPKRSMMYRTVHWF